MLFLKKLDFISQDITLFYKGNEKHTNIISSILSILVFIVIIFLICYLSIDVIAKKHPTSFYFTKFIEEIDECPLNSSALFHYVSLFNPYNQEVKVDRKAIYVIGISINDALFTSDNNISKYSHWIYEECEISDLGNYYNTYSQNQIDNLTNSLCITKYYDKDLNKVINKNDNNFIYPTLKHGASQHNNFEYGIYFQRCQNHSVINNNNCYSKSDQDKFIKKIIGYEIYFIDHSIDVENYKNPIIYSIHRITSEINANSFVLNHLNFHPVVIRTNDGLFMDNIKNRFSYNFDYNEKITHSIKDYQFLGSFNFWMQNTIDTYDRAYKKIQDIAGGVDGIIQIVLIIVKFINNFLINNYQELSDFNNELNYNLDKKNKIKLKNSFFYQKDNNDNGDNFNNNNKNVIVKDNKIISNLNPVFSSTRSRSQIKKQNAWITNTNTINSDNTFKLNTNNNMILKYKKEKIAKKIKWIHVFITSTKFKVYDYVEILKNRREFIISEERFIEFYFLLNIINDKIQKENNITVFNELDRFDTNNTNNNIEDVNYDLNPPSPLVINKNK